MEARVDLPRRFELDLYGRWVDSIAAYGIDAYTTVSARLGWRPSERLELSLAVDNLFDREHIEYAVLGGMQLPSDRMGRSWFARVSWRPRQ